MVVVALHMLRTFVTGTATRNPPVYLAHGMILLVLTLVLGFSGCCSPGTSWLIGR